MVLIDMDMPDCCGDCGLLSKFDDDQFGCEIVCDDNGYGLAIITDPQKRLALCPLKDIDPYIKKVLMNKLDELLIKRKDISREIDILNRYIHID